MRTLPQDDQRKKFFIDNYIGWRNRQASTRRLRRRH